MQRIISEVNRPDRGRS